MIEVRDQRLTATDRLLNGPEPFACLTRRLSARENVPPMRYDGGRPIG
jgi:hypothetical protein